MSTTRWSLVLAITLQVACSNDVPPENPSDTAGTPAADAATSTPVPAEGGNGAPGNKCVQPYFQESSQWCWAAVGQTLMEYLDHGHNNGQFPQDAQMSKNAGITCAKPTCYGSCWCTSENPPACDAGGYPDFQGYGFKLAEQYSATQGSAVGWPVLKSDLVASRPVGYAWRVMDKLNNEPIGGHMVLLTGYSETADGVTLLGFDPLPEGCGSDNYSVSYDDYNGNSEQQHDVTYHGLVNPECEVSERGPPPPPVPPTGDGTSPPSGTPEEALARSCSRIRNSMPLSDHLDLPAGWPCPQQSRQVSLAQLSPREVCHDALRHPVGPSPNRIGYLLTVDEASEDSNPLLIQVDNSDGGWRPGSFERSVLTARLGMKLARCDADASCVFVRVPGLNRRLLVRSRHGTVEEICDLDKADACELAGPQLEELEHEACDSSNYEYKGPG